MKKQSIYAISKTFLTVLLISLLGFKSTYASAGLPDKPATANAQITYVGLHEKSLLFNVNYNNELNQPFELVVKNEDEDIIYARRFDAKPLNRAILFSQFPENCKLSFIITSGKNVITQSFEINTQVKTVEEYIVKGI